MEIRNLITFVRIAEVQSFSKTAEQLGYSQSAVTMQIKQLEGELGTQLFERIGKQVKLTQAGERLLPYALEILDSMRKAESIVQEPEEISGKLHIGTCESYVTSILPSVIMEFSQQCPMWRSAPVRLSFRNFCRCSDKMILIFCFFWIKNFIFLSGSRYWNSRKKYVTPQMKLFMEQMMRKMLYRFT